MTGVNGGTLIRQGKWTVYTSVSTAVTVSNILLEELFEVTTDPCSDPWPPEDTEGVCPDKITLER